MSLYISDVFKIFNNYEPTRIKIWEIVRSFDYIEIAKLLFLLENTVRDRKRCVISLTEEQIEEFIIQPQSNLKSPYIMGASSSNSPPSPQQLSSSLPLLPTSSSSLPSSSSSSSVASKVAMADTTKITNCSSNLYDRMYCNNSYYNQTVALSLTPSLRIERVQAETTKVKWKKRNKPDHMLYENVQTTKTIHDNTNELIGHHYLDVTIDVIMNALRNSTIILPITNVYASILMHNLGTTFYGSFVGHIETLLLPENLQSDRNDTSRMESITARFLQYHKMITEWHMLKLDSRSLRFVMIPPAQRIYNPNALLENATSYDDYVFQPLYQGFHVVVYGSCQETRCYNRYGELIHNIGYNLKLPLNCTFEGVILPLDHKQRIRSWRYWNFRHSYIIYIVDVFRFEQEVLLDKPFKTRIVYADMIIDALHQHTIKLQKKINNQTQEKQLKYQQNALPIDTTTTTTTTISTTNIGSSYKCNNGHITNSIDADATTSNSSSNKRSSSSSSSSSRSNMTINDTSIINNFKIDGNVKYNTRHRTSNRINQNELRDHISVTEIIHKLPSTLCTWMAIEKRYERNEDVFDPIVGVVIRKKNDMSLGIKHYKFNIRYLYDTFKGFIQIENYNDVKHLNFLQIAPYFEMVDFFCVAIIYADCQKYLYICEYDRDIQQFVHRAKIQRLPYDDSRKMQLHYKPETIYVVNNQAKSQISNGIIYVRLYYDLSHRIIGYEFKMTDGRYKIPYNSKIFNKIIV